MRALLYLRELVKREKISLYLESFKKSERLSIYELKRFQCEKLKELLQYLIEYNPFYSQYLQDNGIHLDKSLKDDPFVFLNKLPVVDKQFIKKNIQRWLTTNKNSKLSKDCTSGSTGLPLVLYHSSVSRDVKAASKFRLLTWHGVKRGEKQLYYGGMTAEESVLSSLKIYLNNRFVLNKIVGNLASINNHKIANEIKRINKEKPVTIWGYSSVIFEIAKYSVQNDLPINNKKLRMVILSGESYTPYMKDIVRQAFQLEPDVEYNSTEGFLAGTCELHKLHLNEDTLIAEILNDKGEVTTIGKGELLVTYLYSYDFPFIRYKTGDIVEITEEKCECGRNLKVLKSLDGRAGSFIYNGKDKISHTTQCCPR